MAFLPKMRNYQPNPVTLGNIPEGQTEAGTFRSVMVVIEKQPEALSQM